jgi:hypothetical protein
MSSIAFPVDSRHLFFQYQTQRFGGPLRVRRQREWAKYMIHKLDFQENQEFITTAIPPKAGGQWSKVTWFSQSAAELIMEVAKEPQRYCAQVRTAFINHEKQLQAGHKKCSRCKRLQPLTAYRLIKKKFGEFFESWCKICYDDRKRRDRTLLYQSLRGALTVQWNNIRQRAKSRDIVCDIDLDFLVELWEAQKGRCAYSGLAMTYIRVPRKGRSQHGRTSPSIVSVDRIESTGGYTRDNIILCRWDVNCMKHELSVNQFIFLANSIAAHTKKRKKKEIDASSTWGNDINQ